MNILHKKHLSTMSSFVSHLKAHRQRLVEIDGSVFNLSGYCGQWRSTTVFFLWIIWHIY